MAKAYQCDRCFQYYTDNKEVLVPGFGTDKIARGMSILGPNTSTAGSATQTHKDYELCDACLKELNDWLAFRNIKK